MPRYSGIGAAASGADKTIINLISAATIRPKLYDLLLACGAAPADVALKYHIERFTVVGTEGSGFTPVPLDPSDQAARADYGVAHGSEPTYTANAILMSISLNQRLTFRWIAAPLGELISPATAGNGIGLQCQAVTTGTPTFEATMFHEE